MSNDISVSGAIPSPGVGGDPDSVGETRTRLHGNLGTFRLLITVLGFNAPLGITAGVVPLVIGFGIGLGAPLLFIGLAVVMLLLAVGYSAMARLIPRAGAFYTFITAGLGRPTGLAGSFVATLTYTAGLVYTLIFLGISVQTVFATTLGIQLPWWAGAVVLAIGVGILGYLRVTASVVVIGVLLLLELIAVLVFDAAVVFQGGATGHLTGIFQMDPATLTGGGIALGAIFALTCFSGFETTAIFRDEVRDPKRTVPRATYAAVAVVGVFYTVQSYLLIQGLGDTNAVGAIATTPTTIFVDSVATYLGVVVRDFTIVLIVTSGFASITTFHNVVARYLFNLSTDGVLPKQMGVPHPRFGSPYRTSLIISGITFAFLGITALAGIDPQVLYVFMSGAAGYAFVVMLALVAVAIAVYLLRTKPAELTIWHRAIAPVIAAIALLVILYLATTNLDLLSGSRLTSVISILVIVVFGALGLTVALWLRKKRYDTYLRIGTEY